MNDFFSESVLITVEFAITPFYLILSFVIEGAKASVFSLVKRKPVLQPTIPNQCYQNSII